ncbi:hypothetical protein MSAN_01840100 [Mycena sanguinolenta]|uniref:Uncharacterized protein n=1 Tax=Mycena sanguinolenta TaxID=230812 RepID=A0A8H6XRG0_9AGAR|nr:hypothetical protein MSAN_01840100 [Mycena sanguinolenta]
MRTAVRAASPHCRLVLNAVHHISRPHEGRPAKTRFPDNVDVVLASDLVFTLSGVLNGVEVASDDLLRSQLSQHLVDYFKAVQSVSAVLDTPITLCPVKIVSSRCLTPETELRRVHVCLVGIDLNYVWHTTSESTANSLVHPFSTHLSLPFKMLLDDVISRFFKWQLVRRYPLIFGLWCQQLDIERPYFAKIYRSISSIINRSPNASFRKKCTRMLQTMQEQHSANFTAAANSLATYFGASDGMEEEDEHQALTDDEAFSLSMEIRYRTCLRRPQFKGTTHPQANDVSDDEELSQDQSLITPESSQCFDENYLWSIPPVPCDSAFDSEFDLLALPSANIEHPCVLDMGIEKEYQDPTEFWSDLDDNEVDHDLLLSLSSADEAPLGHQAHSQEDLLSTDFCLTTPDRYGRNRQDVNIDHDRHAPGSPDAPRMQTSPTRIQLLSPPAASAAGSVLRAGPAEGFFPGLSSMQCQADTLDLELSFDSDMENSSSDAHDLEEFEDALHENAHVPFGHQAGNGDIAAVGAGMDGIDEDGAFRFALDSDEDW